MLLKNEMEMDKKTSIRRGSASQFNVYGDYKIAISEGTEYIVAIDRGSVLFSYYPLAHAELPSVFAGVDVSDDEKILEFVRLYGVIGTDALIHEYETQNTLNSFKKHVRTVKLVLLLVKSIQEEDKRLIQTLINDLWILDNSYMSLVQEQTDVFEYARKVVCALINENIKNVYSSLTLDSPMNKGWHSSKHLHFQSLVQVIYWHLASLLETGNVRLCVRCGKPLISSDGRQQFCLHRLGERESRCAVLVRQAKWRKKHKTHNG